MAFLYPWGNTQQLNLDWILQKIKDLEAGGGASLDEVANALISASYAVQAYDRSDIVFRDGKLYRANQAIPAPGEVWTPAHWDEILLGDTVSNLVQYVAALSNDQIANSSSVSGDHTSDALDTLKNAIDDIPLDSDNISNESQVAGVSVTDALDTLNGAISDEATARENADTTLQNSITTLQNTLNTPETITLNASAMTFDSGISLYDAAQNYIYRIGKMCILSFSIKLEGIQGTAAKDIKNYFPIGWRPNNIYSVSSETGIGDGKLQGCRLMYTNAMFRVFPVNNGTSYAIGSCAYICE